MVRKLFATSGVLLLLAGCAAQPPPAPPPATEAAAPAEPSVFIHHIEWRGQTLGQIARWYTGDFANWKKLTKPVNPDLEHCCLRLRMGRDVAIPRDLLVRTDPMPKPVTRRAKPRARAGAATAAAAKREAENAMEEDGEPKDEAKEPPVVSEAPVTPTAVGGPAEPPAIIAEAPPRTPRTPARGTVDFKGSSWTIADAIAYPGDRNTIDVALSSKPFDRGEFAKDGKLDSFDVLRHQMDAHARTVTLRIGGDGTLDCFDYQLDTGGGSSCGTAQSRALKLTRRTDDVIAGRFDFHEGADRIDARFDLPIIRQVERPGAPLPADGGEPGKAVLANFDAMRSGDFERLKDVSPPEKRRQMDATSLDESDQKAMLEFLKAAAASDVEILGGTIDGDAAWVDYRATRGGKPVTGTAELERVDGRWYVKSDTSR